MRTVSLLLASLFLLTPFADRLHSDPAAPTDGRDRCDVRRELSAELPASALGGVLVQAAAGSLEIDGDDQTTIRVRGVVCAATEELASDARLVVEARREAAWIETVLPETRGRRNDYARMDLVVVMPSGLPADVRDGSGSVSVRGIAAVRIEDGSGGIEVVDVAGPVEIEDRSGGIEVREVGSVQLRDGSGEIDVEGVRADVRILDDGSGSIAIADVGGDVRIDEDGSGSIRVERVAGDLVVLRDGSGSIDVRDVEGRVQVPDRR